MARNSRRRREKRIKAKKKAEAIVGGQPVKKNKGKRMAKKKPFWNFNSKVTKPIVQEDPESLSIILYRQQDLDEIAARCKPKAGGSEFQVHFRGTQFIIEHPEHNRRLVFSIPTYYFNMPQTVSTAAVNFNLDEVAAISEKIAPISEVMAQSIAAAFPIKDFEDKGFTVKIRELEMGSIHRHPGDFGFSGTDLDNQVENPGVIFRNLKCDDKVQVDSVMYIPGESVKIVVTETRIVTVAPSDDEGIEGVYNEAPTVSYILQDGAPSDDFHDFFGETESNSLKYDYKINQKWITEKYPEIGYVMDKFIDGMQEIDDSGEIVSEYTPGLLVDPELITSTSYAAAYRKPYHGHNNHQAGAYNMYGYDADDDADFWTGGAATHTTTTKKPGVLPAATAAASTGAKRPPWRLSQTMGLLRTKGLNPKLDPDITGDASDKDIIAITKMMKAAGKDDNEIRSLFTAAGYPTGAIAVYYVDMSEQAKTEREAQAALDKTAADQTVDAAPNKETK